MPTELPPIHVYKHFHKNESNEWVFLGYRLNLPDLFQEEFDRYEKVDRLEVEEGGLAIYLFSDETYAHAFFYALAECKQNKNLAGFNLSETCYAILREFLTIDDFKSNTVGGKSGEILIKDFRYLVSTNPGEVESSSHSSDTVLHIDADHYGGNTKGSPEFVMTYNDYRRSAGYSFLSICPKQDTEGRFFSMIRMQASTSPYGQRTVPHISLVAQEGNIDLMSLYRTSGEEYLVTLHPGAKLIPHHFPSGVMGFRLSLPEN
jgi:hypothetical protein